MSQPHALIIEDNSKNAAVLGKLLAKEGVTFTQILDPNQLPTALESLPPSNIVFVDLEMPGKSGYDILEMLNADAHFQGVPIVTYTVHVSEINTAYQSGFHSFLPKPLDPDRFPDQLARILNGERIWERV